MLKSWQRVLGASLKQQSPTLPVSSLLSARQCGVSTTDLVRLDNRLA